MDSQALDILFDETKKVFDRNTELIERITIIEREKLQLQEIFQEVESQLHSATAENAALKRELDYEKGESSIHLSQVYRLQNKIDEIKRMGNDEFIKVKRDEIRIRRDLEDMKLKYKRSNDELTKLKQKEEEVNELKEYFHHKKQTEENESVKKQLQFEKEKLSLLGLLRYKSKHPIM